MAQFKNFLPFLSAATPAKNKTAIATKADSKSLGKLFRLNNLALDYNGGGSGSRANFEDSPYDFDKIIQAIDTDSYVKQAFAKYRELIWKEGWSLVGPNMDAVDYLYQRFEVMELVMRRTVQDVFIEAADQFVKFSNAFIAKARGDISSVFPMPVTPVFGAKETVTGYYVVPAETMKIQRDKNNVPQRYQQDAEGGGSGKPPEWDITDMVHLHFDRKPGRIFGTPFIISVLDDIIALRQIEEDIQNLVHKELFPLYLYRVGTEDNPAEQDEIDNAATELSNLRTDGGLILPERHDVDVLGADGNAMDANEYLRYFQERVVVGLGLAPHHLGIMNAGGNRSVTDRLDIALYDKVKVYQRYIADMVRIHIVNELLYEGGFDPIGNPEDRVFFRFNEIDTDTQVKKNQDVIQMYTANVLELEEARIRLGLDPEVDESRLMAALQARMAPDSVVSQKTATGGTTSVQVDTTPKAAKSDAAEPSKGGKPNASNKANRQSGNAVRPQNQFGRRMSPNIRRSELPVGFGMLSELDELVELIDGEDV